MNGIPGMVVVDFFKKILDNIENLNSKTISFLTYYLTETAITDTHHSNFRFETQQEMNRQLERQLEALKNKIQKSHGMNKKDIVALKTLEDMSDVMLNLTSNYIAKT